MEQYIYDIYSGDELETKLDNLERWFGDRGYRDLAEYELFYKGRMIPEGESVLGNNGKPRFSVDQIIELDIMSSDPKFIEESEDKYSMIYAYNTKIDRRHFGGKFYSTKYLGCKSEWDKFNWKVIDKAINGPVKKQADDCLTIYFIKYLLILYPSNSRSE